MPFRLGTADRTQERTRLQRLLQDQVIDYHVIFGGDMNEQPGGELDACLGAVCLKDGETVALRNIINTDQPTFRSRHWFALHAKRSLDRVFVSTGVDATAHIGDRRQSDHHPIIVSVRGLAKNRAYSRPGPSVQILDSPIANLGAE